MNGMPNNPGMPIHGMSNATSMMPSGRRSPNEFNQQGGYNYNHAYGGEPQYQPQMKPPNAQPQGQQMHYQQNYPSYEDRENQGSLTMNQGPPGPGPAMNNMPYNHQAANKPYQPHGQRTEVPGMMNQGGMNQPRGSPVEEYTPHGKAEYMPHNPNGGANNGIPQPPQQYAPRDQGYNPPQNNYNRAPPLESYNVPPPMNTTNGYGGGNMPFYAAHNSRQP